MFPVFSPKYLRREGLGERVQERCGNSGNFKKILVVRTRRAVRPQGSTVGPLQAHLIFLHSLAKKGLQTRIHDQRCAQHLRAPHSDTFSFTLFLKTRHLQAHLSLLNPIPDFLKFFSGSKGNSGSLRLVRPILIPSKYPPHPAWWGRSGKPLERFPPVGEANSGSLWLARLILILSGWLGQF